MKTLSNNNDLIIKKSDKGNSVVLINKSDYRDKMYNILSDSKKIVKSSLVDEKHLNFIIGVEKKLTNLLEELKASETISENDYKKLKPRGSSFGILYGLCKTHKKVLDKSPPFRCILSAIKTPSYSVAKFLVPHIEPITKNNFTVKNSFEFCKEICEQNSEYFMASLGIESIFTNIPLEETIKICCDSLCKNQELLSNINKNQFEKLLRAALCNNYFLFDSIVYQQVDGVAMGSPLDRSLTNAFLAHYEEIWLNDCLDEFKPVYYNRYVEDIFVLFCSPHHLEKFNEYLNTKHANIKFTNENEVNGSLPFLDVLISQNNKGFTTMVYHKLTFSGVYSNFNSFIADDYKHGLIFTLLFRIFSIVSEFSKFHEEVNYLKNVLKKNIFLLL